MNGASTLMTIFGVCIFFFGLYIYKGHDVSTLLWDARYQNLSKNEWKNIGNWTMIVSIIPLIIAIIIFFIQ